VGLNADGNLLAVGATGEETAPDAAQNSGAVYVYRRTGNTWAEDGYLKASNPGADDSFGERVTVSADGLRVAVGATAEDSSIGGINSVPNDSSASTGAVYVFRHGETGWSEEAYVKPLSTISNDLFGSSISLSADGSVLAIGADSDVSMTLSPGRAYVFRRTGSVWTEEATLFARDKGPADYFGDSLSLSADGNTLAVGAPGEDSATSGVNSTPNEGATGSGSAYLFRRSAGVWTQEVYFKADNVGANDGFGDSVSLSADGRILAIGAAGEKSTTSGINSTSNDLGGFVGAVYVFRQSDTTWAQIAYVKASSPGSNDRFSFNWLALSADGTTMAVPSQGEASSTRGVNTVPNDFAARTGAAYVFH
jgi:hypothetical protein